MKWLNGKEFFLLLLLLGMVGVHPNGMSQTNEAGAVSDLKPVHEIQVYKTPMCGCCTQWVEHLQANGFNVQVETVEETSSISSALGVPQQLGSCHTAVIGGYWVEGHVPADLIRKLLEERPADIKGIAVPGMVQGSPGMESPHPVKYEVLSVDDKGQVAVYATRKGESVR